MEQHCHCKECMFCVALDRGTVRCNNADLAEEAGWEAMYFSIGFLEFPAPEEGEKLCFWYVPRG